MKTIEFTAADELIITGNRNGVESANLNQISGPSFTLIDDKPIACGGFRIHGVAEAWFVMSKEAREKHLKAVIRACKEKLEQMQRDEKIFQMYARSDISDNFLQHLGFEKKDNIFVR